MPADQIGHHQSRSFVGNVTQLRACKNIEQFTRHMHGAAHARRTVSQFPRPGFGEGDKFLQGRCRHGRVNHQHIGRAGHGRYADEIPCNVVRQPGHQAGQHCQRGGKQKHGIAVRRRLGRSFGTNHRIAAGTIVYHHLLSPHFGQLGPNQPGYGVRAAARRIGNDKPDRLNRIRLRYSNASQQQARSHKARAIAKAWIT